MRLGRLGIGCLLVSLSAAAVYGTWRYVLGAATDAFESDALKVKQAYFESIAGTSTTLQAFQSFVAVGGEVEQQRFGRFAADVMAKSPAVVGVTYYQVVRAAERPGFEDKMRSLGLATSLVEGGATPDAAVKTATPRQVYVVVAAVDAAAKANAYFAWDLLSDASRQATATKVLQAGEPLAVPSFLLDTGHLATEIFAPVPSLDAQGNELSGDPRGLIGLTLDLTKSLGDEQWQNGMTIFMTSVLPGDATVKDLYRHADRDPAGAPILATLTSGFAVEKFGQKLGLKFERQLFPARLRLSLVFMALAAVALISVLSFYLLMTYGRLKVLLADLAVANRTLEERVAARTNELALAHREIKEILDNVDEVVLPVTADLRLSAGFSRASSRLLGKDLQAGDLLTDMLFAGLSSQQEADARHLFALKMLASMDDFQWTLSEGELLTSVVCQVEGVGARTFALRYSPIFEQGALKRLVVVANDITEIVALRATLAAKDDDREWEAQAFAQLEAAQQATASEFFTESTVRLGRIGEASAQRDAATVVTLLFRELHTLKGSARTAGLGGLARAAHHAEDLLEGLREPGEQRQPADDPGFNAALAELNTGFAVYQRMFQRLNGGSGQARGADEAMLLRLEQLLGDRHNDHMALANWLGARRTDAVFSLNELFATFAGPLQEIASSLGKEVALLPPAEDLYLPKNLQADLKEAFTHALRNAVDHGIEAATARVQKGKPSCGSIALEIDRSDGQAIGVHLRDDGGGIDAQRVYTVAADRGLVVTPFAEMTEAAVLDLLFAPGLSTKAEVTELSGRGVGLDAVRAALGRHGVGCSISRNAPRPGSTFALALPPQFVVFSIDGARLADHTSRPQRLQAADLAGPAIAS